MTDWLLPSPSPAALIVWSVWELRDDIQVQLEAGARRYLTDVLWQARQYRRAWLAAEREDA